MVCGLFSVFDPVASIPFIGVFGMKWFSSLCLVFCLFWQLGPLQSGLELVKKEISMFIVSMVGKSYPWLMSSSMVFSALITTLLVLNLGGLVPMSFSLTSHPIVVLPVSLLMFSPWLFVSISSKGYEFLSHFLPKGSPLVLWWFLILVETVSMFIRPFTLAIRLVANVMAGHLFIEMLSSIMINPILYPSLSFLLTFEVIVSVIQAYVFTNLVILYWSE